MNINGLLNYYSNSIRKDKRMYVQCFRQIVDKNPTPQNYVLLGDAFMAIEEPDKALEIYEQVWTILH